MCLLNSTGLYDELRDSIGKGVDADFILVPLDTFPATLKKTNLYKNIHNDHKNNPKIPLPYDVYRNEMNLSILLDMMRSLMDLIKLLPDGNIPHSNYDFIIRNKKYIIPYLSKLKKEFEMFSFMDEIEILISTPEREIIKKIVEKNRKHLLIYCFKNKLFDITPQKVFDIASEYYNIDILEYIFKNHRNECNFNSDSDSDSGSDKEY